MVVSIVHLVDAPGAVTQLARWFETEWGTYYGPTGPGDAESDLLAACSRDQLPICLVALDDAGDPVGTIALKESSIESHRHLGPWLAAFLVSPAHRRQRIGSALVAALEDEARRLGFTRIYTATDTATKLIEARGWRSLDQASILTGMVTVYVIDL